MDPLFRDAIAASRPSFRAVTVEAPITLASIRPWQKNTTSIWLSCGLNEDGSYNIVYDVGQAQN
jgi:hypothetical protein